MNYASRTRTVALTCIATLGILSLGDSLLCRSAFGQQRYVLEVPGEPEKHSKAVKDDSTLTITGPDGEITRYERSRSHDSPDGQYLAYYWADGRQYIRFPVNDQSNPLISRDGVSWRQAQMQVRLVGDVHEAGQLVGPIHLDALPIAGGDFVVGYIDVGGKLRFWRGGQSPWRQLPADPPGRYKSGAPLKLVNDPSSQYPKVYTIDASGQLVEVTNAITVNALPLGTGPPAENPPYLQGSHTVAGTTTGGNEFVYAVNRSGMFFRRWDGSVLPQGDPTPLSIDPSMSICAFDDHVFFVDQSLKLRGLEIDTAGALVTPTSAIFNTDLNLLQADFRAGGAVAAAMPTSSPTVHLATVENRGRLVVLQHSAGSWQPEAVGSARYAAGVPIAMAQLADRLSIALVDPAGRLFEAYRTAPSQPWRSNLIGLGFVPGGPVILHPAGPYCFAIDRVGNFSVAKFDGSQWRISVGTGGGDLAARLVIRRAVETKTLEPVRIEFSNSFNEPVYVEIHKLSDSSVPIKMHLSPDGRETHQLERDGEVIIEDTYEFPDAAGGAPRIERRRYPAASEPKYKVYVVKEPSPGRYISLGMFVLPPGEEIKDGDQIDAYQRGLAAGNPGSPEFQKILEPK